MTFNSSKVINVIMRCDDSGEFKRVYIVSKGKRIIEYVDISVDVLIGKMIDTDLYDMLLCDYVNP